MKIIVKLEKKDRKGKLQQMRKTIKMIVSALLAVAIVSVIVPWSKLNLNLTASAEEGVSLFTVTLDPNGGSLDITTVSVEAFAPIGELPEPTRDGYVFLGWYTQKDGGEKVDSNYSTHIDRTLYAHWRSELLQGLMNSFRNMVTIFILPFALPVVLLAVAPPVGVLVLLPVIPIIEMAYEIFGIDVIGLMFNLIEIMY